MTKVTKSPSGWFNPIPPPSLSLFDLVHHEPEIRPEVIHGGAAHRSEIVHHPGGARRHPPYGGMRAERTAGARRVHMHRREQGNQEQFIHSGDNEPGTSSIRRNCQGAVGCHYHWRFCHLQSDERAYQNQ